MRIRYFLVIYWCILIFVQLIHSNCQQIDFISFCNQSVEFSSPMLIKFKPVAYSSCCSVILNKPTTSPNLSEQIIINIVNQSAIEPLLKISNKQNELIQFHSYILWNRTSLQSDIVNLPIVLSLCQFNIGSFDTLITNISKGPCKPNQYSCANNTSIQDQYCIDKSYQCDGYHSCPQGGDEYQCQMPNSKPFVLKPERTIRGSIVTTVIVIGLLLIVGSLSIALGFVYLQRKRLRERQLAYSADSTSDDWESAGTGYHLFSNSNHNRRHTNDHADNVIIDTNEHMPIATNITTR